MKRGHTGNGEQPLTTSARVSGKTFQVTCLFVGLAAICIAFREHFRQTAPPCDSSYHYFSTRTSYAAVRGHDFGNGDVSPDCQVHQLYMVVRHGTRYPGKDEIEKMNFYLPSLRDKILSHSNEGRLCQSTLNSLRLWEPSIHPDSDLYQAEAGTGELRGLGERLSSAYPSLLNISQTSQGGRNTSIEVRHTMAQRSRLSAEALIDGIFKHASQDVVSSLKGEFISNPQDEENLLQNLDSCNKYLQQSFMEESIEVAELTKFDHAGDFEKTLRDLDRRVGLSTRHINFDIVSAMYEACRYEYALYNNDTWCQVLGKEALEVFEYRQDMKYYWRYGYGRIINYQPSCMLIQDMVESIRNYILHKADIRVIVRMGHSRTILPLLTRLGYYKGDPPLLAKNFNHQKHRRWRLSLINPFSSNFVVLLVKCGQEYFLRTYVNENEVAVPGCGWPCPVREAFIRWKYLARKCDINAMCDNEASSKMTDSGPPIDRS